MNGKGSNRASDASTVGAAIRPVQVGTFGPVRRAIGFVP
jgi:hypothetical protein